jgi:hypothetical protein
VIANTRAGQITIFRSKCIRAGRCRVQHLIEERGGNAKLIDWLDEITRLSEEASPQYERSMRGSLPTFTIICGLIGAVAMAQDKNIEAAKQGAESWLAVVDKGDTPPVMTRRQAYSNSQLPKRIGCKRSGPHVVHWVRSYPVNGSTRSIKRHCQAHRTASTW